MTPAETVAWGALLDAISGHLPAPGPGPEQDVRLACAAVIGCGCAQDAIERFAALLTAAPAFTPACQSCGATGDLDAVHFPGSLGLAARAEYYCHDSGECAKRRRDCAVAISGIAS